MFVLRLFRSQKVEPAYNLQEIPDIDRRLQDISKILKKNKLSSKERGEKKEEFGTLRTRLVVKAFNKRKADGSYQMPETAKKVYEAAKTITENQFHNQILDHGEEFAFLTNERHHIHKHIETLERWNGPKSSKVIIDRHGNVKLQTHHESRFGKRDVYHTVTNLMDNAEKDKDLVYELNYFDLIAKKSSSKPLTVSPAFQTVGDGQYHVALVTDCPKKMSLTGNHAWIRLIDDKGHVSSVGKFPEELKMPFLFRKEATLFSTTDKHEWLCRKGTIKEHRFTITKDDFENLKDDIENDLQSASDPNGDDQEDFNVFKENCSDWGIEKLNRIGLTINKKDFQIDQFTLLFPKLGEWYRKWVPSKLRVVTDPIKSIISVATLQFARIGMIYIFGGNHKNKKNKQSRRFIHSPKQIVSRRLTHLTHPWKMREYLDKNQANIQNNYNSL